MHLRSRCAILLVAVATATSPLLTYSSTALAADETARARTLFQEGVQLEAGGNFAAALAKFQEVAQVKRTPQVAFHIALCQEKLGHLVEALGGYRIVAHDAAESNDPKLAKVAEAAEDAVKALEKRIPTLTVKRGKGAQLAKVRVDGVDIGATVGKAQQVDPGAHVIEATVSEQEPFKEIVQLAESESKTVEVKFKEEPVKSKTPTEPMEPPKDAPPPPAEQRSIAPYVVMGAGGVSLLASGLFYILRSGAKSDLEDGCHGNICPESLRDKQDTGKTMTTLGNITLGLGVVGVGVGAVMLLTQKPSQPVETAKAPRVDLQLRPVSGGMGASFVGQFLSPKGRLSLARAPRSAARLWGLRLPRRLRVQRRQVQRGWLGWQRHVRQRRHVRRRRLGG